MKVKQATQVMSHTVAAAIGIYVSVGALPPTAMDTAELIESFDSISDYVNSSTLHSTKKLKCAISDQTTDIQFMKESMAFIKRLQVERVVNYIKCNYFNMGTPKDKAQFQVSIHQNAKY